MRVLQQLVPSRSNSSASRHPLLPRSGWRPLNDALADYPLASFSDNFTAPSGILWPFFLAFFFLIFYLFGSPFRCFFFLLQDQRPVLNDSRSSNQD